MNRRKNPNPPPIAGYGLIDDRIFDLEQDLADRWIFIFPKGKMPDRIRYLLSEVRREWYLLLAKASRQ